MKNLWSDVKAAGKNDLALRVYSSNLLGQSSDLVLHGGGNTSVKSTVDTEEILFVKGSGWDLVSIKEEGFSAVKMQTLLKMAALESLSDSEMVAGQKAAMLDSSAPNPSVEAILHALIPYKFVDHTHADAIVSISNSVDGKRYIKELFPRFLIVDYIMPGFDLAHQIYKMTRDIEWESIEGIILHNHGIFTFDDSAKSAYTKMIDAVTVAENFLVENASFEIQRKFEPNECDVTKIVKHLSELKGYKVYLNINQTPLANFYASQEELVRFASRGVLTPEHIIRTKRVPLIIENGNLQESLKKYVDDYIKYFKSFATNEVMLNPAPNYMIIKNCGLISFGATQKEADIVNDIVEHTMKAVLRADKLGGYQSISLADSFAMEYWELEQIKLKKI